ncbi:hypothetical protein DFH27DRAFT_586425 [Peziza echinospora]|nr:hypothetical protein DFH27DRAFT_586425 [Peziza echinospora]
MIPEETGKDVILCEINARFLWNGFWIGTLQGEAVEKGGKDTLCGEGLVMGGVNQDGMYTAFNHLIDPTLPLGILADKEYSDGHFFDSSLVQHVYPLARVVKPSDLTLENGVLSDQQGPITQFVLELHQHELEGLSEEILFHLAQICYNDLRSIYFVHDKRMLGVLRRELDWLVKVGDITVEQAGCLRRGLPETYTPCDEAFENVLRECESAPEKRREWVLKKCMAGKGDGMVFGKSVSGEDWLTRMRNLREGLNSTGAPYILQRYVPQRKFTMHVHPRDNSRRPSAASVREVSWPIIGSLLCVNDMYLGSPMWRTNSADIIAVGDNGLTAPSACQVRTRSPPRPPLRKLLVPASARVTARNAEDFAAQASAARESLLEHGLAVVDMQFDDPDSNYVLKLIDHLDLGEEISHSSTHGVLWDVRPVEGMTSVTSARSMTMESFPWHTDCSYEARPPRYFALHILHRDRFGGGVLRLMSTESIVSRLTPQSREVLQKNIFSVTVPEEFRKDEDKMEIIAPVLAREKGTGLWKIRYRRDIVEGLTPEAKKAVEELDRVTVMDGYGHARALGEDVMRDRAIVLLDNARWLHARSDVRDPQRWLRRARWGPQTFEEE